MERLSDRCVMEYVDFIEALREAFHVAGLPVGDKTVLLETVRMLIAEHEANRWVSDGGRMTVEKIVANYLREHGYDGLYNSGECCCKIDDLFPRCTDGRDCEPGVKVPCDPETCSADGDCEYHIGERENLGT